MTQIEIAELAKNANIYEVAQKTLNPKYAMNDGEKVVAEQLDEWARKIGETGNDPEHEIAAFITRTVNDEFYNAPDELMDMLFDRGTIGEFDDYEATVEPIKNTLVAHEAAKGGNVPASYLDISVLKPQWKNKQLETKLSYVDLRKNGWKSVALLTDYAMRALENARFADIFGAIDAGISMGAENYINEAGKTVSQATAEALALYVNDRAEGDGVIVALSKYVQQISKLPGFDSDSMLDEIHRTGRLGMYDGVNLFPISGAKKLATGGLLVPDKRVFGISGKIGTLDMRGEVHTYETMDNNKEVVNLKIADFTYGYSFNKDTLENVCKVVISG
jgi:hypothetical protein|nr:MAG TPA: Major capsid protein [Caudoviricetes sp.]